MKCTLIYLSLSFPTVGMFVGLTRALGARDLVGGPIGPAIAFVHVAIVLRDVRGGGLPPRVRCGRSAARVGPLPRASLF